MRCGLAEKRLMIIAAQPQAHIEKVECIFVATPDQAHRKTVKSLFVRRVVWPDMAQIKKLIDPSVCTSRYYFSWGCPIGAIYGSIDSL
jgi:hypothetical protein